MNVVRKIGVFVIVSGFLSGCGAFHDQGPTASAVQVNAFVNSVKPILKANCFGCHAQSGSGGAVFYMSPSSDLDLYQQAYLRITPNDPDHSLLFEKATGAIIHGGQNALPVASDQQAIKAWINNVGTAPNTGSTGPAALPTNLVYTGAQSVPQFLAVGPQAPRQTVRFGLDNLGHPGAFLEMGIRFAVPGQYEFTDWRVYSPNYPLNVTGINIILSNGNQWTLVNSMKDVVLKAPQSQLADVNSIPLPGNPLSTQSELGFAFNSKTDEISLGFSSVVRDTSSSGGTYTNPKATFTYLNQNILPKCTGCHSTNHQAGGYSYSSYSETLVSVKAGDPANSAFYQAVTTGGMPKGGTSLSTSDLQAISDWISGGAKNN
jgi:mono/diheme cytochrome c family protein